MLKAYRRSEEIRNGTNLLNQGTNDNVPRGESSDDAFRDLHVGNTTRKQEHDKF